MNESQVLTDYHMHSTFSPDGHDSPEMLCRRALELGFIEIAITEHAEWHPPDRGQLGFPLVEPYFEAIERVRAEFGPQGLTVHSGVELGNPHQHVEQATELVTAYPFDLVIGSMHWLYGENIQSTRCFTTDRHPNRVYRDYFVEMERMATGFDFDLVTHFDRIFYWGAQAGAPIDPWQLEPTIRQTLATIARYGRAIELNARYLAHTPNWNDAIVTILQWFLEEGGAFVAVNSDAHRASQLGYHFDIAQDILTRAGFELPEQLYQVAPGLPDALAVQPVWYYCTNV
jgi:histidinol-phosphatase (PHP family)